MINKIPIHILRKGNSTPAYAKQPNENSENAFIKAKICLRRSRVIFASAAFEEFRLFCSSRRFFFGYFLFIVEKKVTILLLVAFIVIERIL